MRLLRLLDCSALNAGLMLHLGPSLMMADGFSVELNGRYILEATGIANLEVEIQVYKAEHGLAALDA